MSTVDKVIDKLVALTVDTNAYSANDVVGGLLTFDVSSPSGCGVLNKILLTDADNEGAALDIYVFSSAPTTIADDAAAAFVIADLKKLVCKIEVAAADYESVNSLKFCIKEDINATYQLGTAGNLYAYVVCTATPTYTAATDLSLTLSVLTS
jgi:hypothetical protein